MSTPAAPNRSSAKRDTQSAPSTNQSSAKDVLAHAQSGREVIQDFCPLAESLEWQLGQQYLRDRGNKAFISDASPVPFVVNNDGTLSRNAAEVFFASLQAAEEAGNLTEPDIFVLELGIGVGLFARYFLDNFRDLCADHNKDYYDRLCYIAADRSERMLMDVARHGVLANHPGRYRLRQVDAMKPETLTHDVMFLNHPGKPLRAVFLNYLLDCLPASVLEFSGEQVQQLCVRTCLGRGVKLEDFTDMNIKALQERAKTNDARAQQELLEVYGLFASEYDYRPVDAKTLPYGDFALDYGRKRAKRLLHSYGAIQSLDRLLDLIRDDGFILINDYGQTDKTRADDDFEHQRFSLATFVGVNFPLLNEYFGVRQKHEWLEPFGGDRGIHPRLLSRTPVHDTRSAFLRCFNSTAEEHRQEPIAKARACTQVGRFELAVGFYQEALQRQPHNWVLLNEISMFLTFSMRDPKAGIDMAKHALVLNPTCSAELWNSLGDGLFEFGRFAEARSAYLRALQVNDSDVRARFNLAWTYQREKKFPAALEMLAQALALDKMGQYRERILHKQHEVLAQLALRHQQEYLLLINLVSKYSKDEDKPKPELSSEQQP